MEEIESFFKKVHGDFVRKVIPIQGTHSYRISYSKPMELYETIEVVLIIPFVFVENYSRYVSSSENCFYFFLYDLETEMIIGETKRFLYDKKWKKKFLFLCKNENKFLVDCFCPKCDFWLVERRNKLGERFIGCSAYPECTYTKGISKK